MIYNKTKSISCKKILSFAVVFAMVMGIVGIKNTQYSYAQNSVQIKDAKTGIIYESDSGELTGKETLEITDVNLSYINNLPTHNLTDEQMENPTDEDMKKIYDNARKMYSQTIYNDFSKSAFNGRYKTFIASMKRDGENFSPKNGGKLLVPIPKDWDKKNFSASVFAFQRSTQYPDETMRTVNRDGQDYLEITDTKEDIQSSRYSLLNKEKMYGNIGLGEIKKRLDVSTLNEGIYEVEPGFLKANTENMSSMADGTLQPKGYLVVNKDGSKEVYLNFKPIYMAGMEAHMATLWNKTDEDVTLFDFVTDKNGSLVSNAGFEPNTEFACLKSARIKLSEDTYDKETFKYHFKVIPPAMGAGQPFKEIYKSPIDADLVFYSAKKLENFDVSKIPTHQKSVLRRSIDKAKKLNSSYYSKDSYSKLASALADGEKYYNELNGKDAGADQNISSAIAKKSEAIETAIKKLQPGEGKTPEELNPKEPEQNPDSKNAGNTKQKSKNSNKKNSSKEKDTFPKTGDNMDLALYLGLVLLSGSAVLVVRTRKSRSNDKK